MPLAVHLRIVRKLVETRGVTEDGGCETTVKPRLNAGWRKWCEQNGRKLPHSLKVKVYCTVKTVRVCEAESWALKRKEEELLMRTQMNMIRWALNVSPRTHKRNEEVRQGAGGEGIKEK